MTVKANSNSVSCITEWIASHCGHTSDVHL